MTRRQRFALVLIVAGILLLWWGYFVLSFLGEPSAVGRLRIALIATGVGSLGVGAAGGVTGVWMLVTRRT